MTDDTPALSLGGNDVAWLKPLPWQQDTDGDWYAKTIMGFYDAWQFPNETRYTAFYNSKIIGAAHTMDGAKERCQKHYETLIRSAFGLGE